MVGSHSVTAQVIPADTLTRYSEPLFINKNVSFYKSLTPISFDSLRKVPGSAFVAFEKANPVIFHGHDPYYYSFRFITHNKDSIPRRLILSTGGLGIKRAELWRVSGNNEVLLGKTGHAYPFSERAYPFVHHSFQALFNPGQTDTFYVIMDESHAYKTFAFVLTHPDAMIKKEHQLYVFFGFLVGTMLLFSVINFYLYFSIREKIHLWYGFYILAMTLFLLKHDGLDAEFLGLDSDTAYRLTPMGGFGVLSLGLLTQVVQLFLQEKIKGTVLNRILSVLKWSAWLSTIAYFIIFYVKPHYIIETFVVEWSTKTILLSAISIFVGGVYCVIKGFRPALFILLGMSVFLAGSITRVLFIGTKSIIFPPNLFQIGLLTEVVIISFGLMLRYNQYKKEKDSLKEKLELQQLQASIEILKTQENEQKRIARDLHDELGGNLAALKMTLSGLELPAEKIQFMLGLIDKTSSSARNIAHNLMPPEFEKTTLTDILTNYFKKLNTENSVSFHFQVIGQPYQFSKQEELMIYRVILELTNNIIRHSRASEANVQFFYFENHLEIMVEDNGIGFSGSSSQGMGIKNVQSRINYLNGKITIDSESHGATIIIHVPFKKTPA